MNKDIFKGKWGQLKGNVKKKWGNLTDDDLRVIEGSRDRLIGKIKERYGKSQEEAEKEVDAYEKELVSVDHPDPDNKISSDNLRRDDHPNPEEEQKL